MPIKVNPCVILSNLKNARRKVTFVIITVYHLIWLWWWCCCHRCSCQFCSCRCLCHYFYSPQFVCAVARATVYIGAVDCGGSGGSIVVVAVAVLSLLMLKGHWTTSDSSPNFFQKSWDFYTIRSVFLCSDCMLNLTCNYNLITKIC